MHGASPRGYTGNEARRGWLERRTADRSVRLRQRPGPDVAPPRECFGDEAQCSTRRTPPARCLGANDRTCHFDTGGCHVPPSDDAGAPAPERYIHVRTMQTAVPPVVSTPAPYVARIGPWLLAVLSIVVTACAASAPQLRAPDGTRLLDLPGPSGRSVHGVHIGSVPGSMLVELPGRDPGLALCRRAEDGSVSVTATGEGALAASFHPSTGQILSAYPGRARGLEFRNSMDLEVLDVHGSQAAWLETQDVVDIAPGRDGAWVVLGIDGQLATVSAGGRVAVLREGAGDGSAHQVRYSAAIDAYALKWAASSRSTSGDRERWVELVDPHGQHVRSIECAAGDRSFGFAMADGVLYQDDGIDGIARWDLATGAVMSSISVPTGSRAVADADDFAIDAAADGSAVVAAWSWRKRDGGAPWHSRVVWLRRSVEEWIVGDELSYDSMRAATTVGIDARGGWGSALVSSAPVFVWDVE